MSGDQAVRKIRYTAFRGASDEAERDRIRKHPLYRTGDTILVWVNEGDIGMVGEYVSGADEPGLYMVGAHLFRRTESEWLHWHTNGWVKDDPPTHWLDQMVRVAYP